MSNDPIDTSVTSETVSSDDIAPNTNYSRWMTDMAADIAHLKLHQLAIPGAHNSGVDRDGNFDIGMRWAACQYGSFPQQLAAGARYLDLRLVDSSYKKDVGGSKIPRYKFIEIFQFKHGIVSVGRRLEHLVEAVKNFSTSNPGEIVFIDFHHYDRGRNYSNTSLERCLPKFNSIKDRLIPSSASDLSIGQIRQQFPGCNIILCLAHGNPETWPAGTVRKEQIWSPLKHYWNSTDASEGGITSLVINSMQHPPEHYGVLSAAVTEQTFPKDLAPNSPVRTENFKAGFQNSNIVMVDFVDGSNSRTSVVDRCILLNKERSIDKTPPSIPTNLTAKKIDNPNSQNSFEISWNSSTDNLGVRNYELFRDDTHIITTSSTRYTERYLPPLKNYTYKIKANDFLRNTSNFSQPYELIQDSTTPTIPDNFRFTRAGSAIANLAWDRSFDAAGIAGYEVSCNKQFVEFTKQLQYQFMDLIESEQYTFEVRAKDNNGLYSEHTTLTLLPRPRLENPKVTITEYLESSNYYRAYLSWDLIEDPQFPISFKHRFRGFTTISHHTEGERPSVGFGSYNPTEEIIFESRILFETGDTASTSIYSFVFDPTAPTPISDLKITSRTSSSTSITWSASTSTHVTNYAISVDEESPTLIPASANSYRFEELPLDKTFSIEVWAISNFDACSNIAPITIDPIDAPPAADPPRNFHVSNIADQRITFAWSPPFADAGKVIEYKFARVVAGLPLPVPVPAGGLQEYLTINDTTPSSEVKVKLSCVLESGVQSAWIDLTVPPRS